MKDNKQMQQAFTIWYCEQFHIPIQQASRMLAKSSRSSASMVCYTLLGKLLNFVGMFVFEEAIRIRVAMFLLPNSFDRHYNKFVESVLSFRFSSEMLDGRLTYGELQAALAESLQRAGTLVTKGEQPDATVGEQYLRVLNKQRMSQAVEASRPFGLIGSNQNWFDFVSKD